MENKEKHKANVLIIDKDKYGKSTIARYLINKCGDVDRRTPEPLERLKTVSTDSGDNIEVLFDQIETSKFVFTLADSSGHQDFMRNWIKRAFKIDVAVVIVEALYYGDYVAGISLNFSFRERILLAFTLGVKHLIVCVDKMDDRFVNWSEERYNEIKSEYSNYVKKIGYNPESVPFIPISGVCGDNLIKRSDNLKWYEGLTLLEALESIPPSVRLTEKPLRIPIEDVYKIPGIGTVVVGRIETGVLKPGMDVTISPGNLMGEVKSIGLSHPGLEEALLGDTVSLNIKGTNLRSIKRGYVIGDPKRDPPSEVTNFLAQLIILNHPGQITKGYCPLIECQYATVICKFVEIKSKINRRTGLVLEEAPKFVRSGDTCIVLMQPLKPLCVEAFSEFPALGRFAVRDMRQIVAVGTVMAVEKKYAGGGVTPGGGDGRG